MPTVQHEVNAAFILHARDHLGQLAVTSQCTHTIHPNAVRVLKYIHVRVLRYIHVCVLKYIHVHVLKYIHVHVRSRTRMISYIQSFDAPYVHVYVV